MKDSERQILIEEYVSQRMAFGDLSEEQDEMTNAELIADLRRHAERLTNEQLITASNSYMLAD